VSPLPPAPKPDASTSEHLCFLAARLRFGTGFYADDGPLLVRAADRLEQLEKVAKDEHQGLQDRLTALRLELAAQADEVHEARDRQAYYEQQVGRYALMAEHATDGRVAVETERDALREALVATEALLESEQMDGLYVMASVHGFRHSAEFLAEAERTHKLRKDALALEAARPVIARQAAPTSSGRCEHASSEAEAFRQRILHGPTSCARHVSAPDRDCEVCATLQAIHQIAVNSAPRTPATPAPTVR